MAEQTPQDDSTIPAESKSGNRRPLIVEAQVIEFQETIDRYPSVARLRMTIDSHVVACLVKFFPKYVAELNDMMGGSPPTPKRGPRSEPPAPKPPKVADKSKTPKDVDESNKTSRPAAPKMEDGGKNGTDTTSDKTS